MKQPELHSAKRFLRPITYGVLCGTAACMLLLVLMSVVMGLQDVPQAAVSLMAMAAFILGGLTAGFVSAGFSREKGLLLGICCGTVLFLMLSVASLPVCGPEFGVSALTKLVAVLCAAAIGGVIGVNKRKKCR